MLVAVPAKLSWSAKMKLVFTPELVLACCWLAMMELSWAALNWSPEPAGRGGQADGAGRGGSGSLWFEDESRCSLGGGSGGV